MNMYYDYLMRKHAEWVVVSGGQTGVDRAALDAARRLAVFYTGWIPKGRIAEDGALPLQYVGMREMPTKNYLARTEKNVIDSDLTILLCYGEPEGGTKRTIDYCEKHHRPYKVIHLDGEKLAQLRDTLEFVRAEHGRILNFAGPRASKQPSIYADARAFIEYLLRCLTENEAPGPIYQAQLDDIEEFMERMKESRNDILGIPETAAQNSHNEDDQCVTRTYRSTFPIDRAVSLEDLNGCNASIKSVVAAKLLFRDIIHPVNRQVVLCYSGDDDKWMLTRAMVGSIHRAAANDFVCVVTAESFFNELLNCEQVPLDGLNSFYRKYYHADYLIVDDIEFIMRSKHGYEALIDVCTVITKQGGRVVFTTRKNKDEFSRWWRENFSGFPDCKICEL